ncbi:type II toxin-antitoxin system RelE/ParE family toxin [Pseudoduganella namucuonensis]|uniref:type II toxin-antitoxin system RelE/ParE family toxin n=1 Tax=Pseudoduganella namucuonensis TaxID=1035707 RepID=UPI000B87C805|nr:type II toxin-antitoxin system RelE/ParE family toxin [Pseudoduganella namucuonensis]
MKRILKTAAFDRWLRNLKDREALRRIAERIDRARTGHFGDCSVIADGVSEMRIHHGPGYRVYFTLRGDDLVILLAGGNKSTQARDIRLALQLALDLRGHHGG